MLCGALSAVGGGILRDVMARKIPAVLVSDFYATAAIIGGGIYIIAAKTELPLFIRFLTVSLSVTAIRLLAIHFRIQLPGSRKRSLAERTKRA